MMSKSLVVSFLLVFVSTNHVKVNSNTNITFKEAKNHNKQFYEVTCGVSEICIKLQTNWLNEIWNIKNFDKISLRSSCDHNLAFVSYKEDVENLSLCSELPQKGICDSSRLQNGTHLIIKNFVAAQKNVSEDNSTREINLLTFECTYESVGNFGGKIIKLSETQFLGNRTGQGRFKAAMILYKDRLYREAYRLSPVINVNSRLRVRVTLMLGPQITRLQIVRCWGTPTMNFKSQSANEFVLIDNYCPVPEAASRAKVDLISNGEHNYASWESMVFRFVNSSYLYLHCNVRVCFENINCKKECDEVNKTRQQQHLKRRALIEPDERDKNDVIVSLGPIRPTKQALGVDEDLKISSDKKVVKNERHFITATIAGFLLTVSIAVFCLLFFVYQQIRVTNHQQVDYVITSVQVTTISGS